MAGTPELLPDRPERHCAVRGRLALSRLTSQGEALLRMLPRANARGPMADTDELQFPGLVPASSVGTLPLPSRAPSSAPGSVVARQRSSQFETPEALPEEPAALGSAWSRLVERLSRPVDAASLAVFRILFGWLMMLEVLRYFGAGWIASYYIEPQFHFTYWGFSWVHPWPGIGMYVHFAALGVLAVCMALGFCYRLSALLFFVGFTYVFLLEKARYLNHFYFIILLSALCACLPLHRYCSIDAKRHPERANSFAPTYQLWTLRAQLLIVYVYAGIAKLNADWFRGEPLRHWLSDHSGVALVGPLFTQDWFILALSYGGLALDLCVAPLLIFRRTRIPALVLFSAFHLMNAAFFEIGIFPWMMLAANLLFLEPSWPRTLLRRVPEVRNWVPDSFVQVLAAQPFGRPPRVRAGALALVGIYLALQLLIPLRHHLYPGDVAWNEEGHRFAWRMKLRDKHGRAEFFVERNGVVTRVLPDGYLTDRQASRLPCQSDMLVEFSHFLADRSRHEDEPVRVRANATCSLNFRAPRRFVDPKRDLAAEPLTILPKGWILPGPDEEALENVAASSLVSSP